MIWMTTENEKFAKWIQAELDRRDMTQADLARQSGLARATISNVVSAQRGAGSGFCRRVAKGLGLPSEVVYEAAGLLPKDTQKRSPIKRMIISLIDKLPTERDDEEVEEYIRLRLRMAEKRSGNETGSKKKHSET